MNMHAQPQRTPAETALIDAFGDGTGGVEVHRERLAPLPLPLRDLGPQRLDVVEVIVHRSGGDTGPVGDFLHARAQDAVAVAGEKRVDDGLAVALPPSRSSVDQRHRTILY